MKVRHLLSLGLVALGLTAPARADLVIDSFKAGPMNVTRSALGTSTATAFGPSSEILGGERDLALTVTANALGLDANARVLTGPGLFTLSNDSKVDSWSSLTYNGGGTLNVDLTPFGNAIVVNIVDIDLSTSMALVLNDGGGPVTVTQTNLTAGPVYFMFSDFAGVDFTKIKSISMRVDPKVSGDLALNFLGVQVVPEPSSIALAGLGLAGLVLAGRRRRAARA